MIVHEAGGADVVLWIAQDQAHVKVQRVYLCNVNIYWYGVDNYVRSEAKSIDETHASVCIFAL